MGKCNFFTAAPVILISFMSVSAQAENLIDTSNFNVTLNVPLMHALTATDPPFGTINPALIPPDSAPLTSASGVITAYSNCMSNRYAQVVPSAPKYLAPDGINFLMCGKSAGNMDSIAFYLQSSANADGSPAAGGAADYYNGSIFIEMTGCGANQRQIRDVWAILTNNAQLLTICSDHYCAVLTINFYMVE